MVLRKSHLHLIIYYNAHCQSNIVDLSKFVTNLGLPIAMALTLFRSLWRCLLWALYNMEDILSWCQCKQSHLRTLV